jgi:hypothetical protein
MNLNVYVLTIHIHTYMLSYHSEESDESDEMKLVPDKKVKNKN